jgi:hypothetical protein
LRVGERRRAAVCEMIFISAETSGSGVFFEALVNTTAGEPMNKSGMLIATALLSVGFAAASIAADAAAPSTAPASGSTHKSSTHHKKSSSHKKSSGSTAAAPTTTK